jgi:hypothetical protein
MIVVFAALATSYGVYSRFLGGIDGLTPLPEDYWPPPPGGALEPPSGNWTRRNKAEERLKEAFGTNCKELTRINKLEIPSRHMVLAVDKFEPVPEGEHKGQILLQPFSVAIFGKGSEINTIRSKEAYLTFDHPISSISEVGRAKIVAAELHRGVEISNNRGTPERRDDDLVLNTEAVFYDDAQHLICTDKPVKLEDSQSRPQPMIITAIGMDVNLTPPENAPAEGNTGIAAVEKRNKSLPARRNPPETVSGVDRITLRTQVQMDLHVDPRSGFMSTNNGGKAIATAPPAQGAKVAAAPEVPAGPVKDHVQITTQGPFTYDVHKDFAVFEISHRPLPLPSRVHVTRRHSEAGNSGEKTDELFCDRLELQFHRKEAAGDPTRSTDTQLDIDWARALQLQDLPVSITSFAEVFNASCYDLRYEARTRQTKLKGNPNSRDNREVVAMKEGNLIKAAELCVTAADPQTPQQVTAKGPGQIDMLDKEKGQRTSHASWRDLLTSTKDGLYDCLILTGDAAFFQDDQQVRIQAEQIKVWLEPAKEAAAPPGQKPRAEKAVQNGNPPGDQQQRLKPHHLEATRRVRLSSPEMNLEEADHLTIWFKDAAQTSLPPVNPGIDRPPPGKANAAGELAGPIGDKKPAGNSMLTANPLLGKQKEPGSSAAGSQGSTAPNAKAKKPLNLKAQDVKAHVIRADNRNDLESLECWGKVRVKQEPAGPDDKGVDIRGDGLLLNHFIDGNILVVRGNAHDLAWVQLDKLTMQGKEVNIDQRANRSWINDIGIMRMLTATDFEGKKLDRATQLTINWNKEMFFDGKFASFSGGVTAEQDNSHLRCQEMQVWLDRPVSFKEGERNSTPAKVQQLVCGPRAHEPGAQGPSKQLVMVDDTKFEGSKLVGYQRLLTQELHVDNSEGKMDAGPGILNLLQLGTAEDSAIGSVESQKPSKNPPAPKAKEELKLTRIYYAGRLHADNKQRIATFYDEVKVYNLPADDPDIRVDEAHPPAGCMILRCRLLKVSSESLPNGQKNQRMQATGQVRIQGRSRPSAGETNSGSDTPDYWGDAQILRYEEKSDWIILDGGDGYAHLYRVLAPGARPDKVEARKIHYNRKDKTYRIDNGAGMELQLPR